MTTFVDPFAALDLPAPPQIAPLYISGRLTLLRIPEWMNTGDWIQFPDHPTHPAWHRRLDAHAFISLRLAVQRTIEAGKLPEEFADALSLLEQIADIGIESGSFTADEIAPGRTVPDWYSFSTGIPHWADDIGPDFLPPQKQNDRQFQGGHAGSTSPAQPSPENASPAARWGSTGALCRLSGSFQSPRTQLVSRRLGASRSN